MERPTISPHFSTSTARVLVIHKGGKVLTWCVDLVAGFREIACEAESVALRSWNWKERREQWSTCKKLLENQATVERCSKVISTFKPELIVFLNFAGLPDPANRILRKAAGTDVPFVGWLADHISGMPLSASPNLDGVYSFDSATLGVLHGIYGKSNARLDLLPLAVNPRRYREHGKPWQERRKGLVFLGNNTPERRALMRQFQNFGGTISAYGPSAETGLRVWRRRRIAPSGASRIYGNYQGVLNMLQSPNTVHGLNLRAFEVPASGGLGTYPLTPDLKLSFIPNREVIAYRDLEDLACQTRILLDQPVLAKNMISAGRDRVMREHTYTCRASRLVSDWFGLSMGPPL